MTLPPGRARLATRPVATGSPTATMTRGIDVVAFLTASAAGVAVATAFLVFGVTRVLPEPVPVSTGARILLFPGAAALWPYVLVRWLKSSR